MHPFHVVGNIYYVGPAGVSSFLITTPQGNILIDGGLPQSAPVIEKNVEALHFHMTDVKILLNSHAHFDHAGGLAELKRVSGAKMVASAPDVEALQTGHEANDGASGEYVTKPVQVDRVIHDGDTVALGGTVLTAHLTPGHTAGCTTWTTSVTEQGKTYQVVFSCSASVGGNRLVNNKRYPAIAADYEHSFATLKKLPCDVFLAPHGEQFHLKEKVAKMGHQAANPFIDPGELRAYVAESEREFQEELRKEEAREKHASGLVPHRAHVETPGL